MTDPVLEALREIVPVTRGQVNFGGRTLRWIESGTGTPAVVLIAGRNDTALSWGPVLAALEGRTHAVAYDRAGLGDSDPDRQIPSAERTVADLSRLISVLSPGPCLIAGHSLGGLLALMLAAAHPGQLAGLVLVDPALPGLLDWMPRPVRRVYGAAARARPVALYAAGRLRSTARRKAESAAAAFSDDPRVRGLVVRAYLASADWPHVLAGYREGQGLAASGAAIRRALTEPPGPPAVSQALAGPAPPRIPMVVISATEGRPAWLRRRWTALHAELAAECGARHVVADGSGHAVPLDRPALVAEAIRSCLQ
ncbi:MAG TPA: alpha/beta hydrolase [Streptosporangiaceae bacterium]|nr:alpha/beta hydrolase [Streptosporangiaceae bacterium]